MTLNDEAVDDLHLTFHLEDMRAAVSQRNLLPGVRGTPTHIMYTPDLEEVLPTEVLPRVPDLPVMR